MNNTEDTAITYLDTRNAQWPYTGMRAGHALLAFEVPNPARHMEVAADGKTNGDSDDYATLFKQQKIYMPNCQL